MLPTNSWPLIQHLDLSYNSMDYRAVLTLTEGTLQNHHLKDCEIGLLQTTTVQVLKLAGCKINPSTSPLIRRCCVKVVGRSNPSGFQVALRGQSFDRV
jgi:hypothetical protein